MADDVTDADADRAVAPHAIGEEVVGADDEVIGPLLEVYLDAATEEPEWLAIAVMDAGCDGCFDAATGDAPGRFAPVGGLRAREDGRLGLRWTREQVLASPVELTDTTLTNDEEDALYRHYGIERPAQWINTGAPGGGVMVGVAGVTPRGPDRPEPEGDATDPAPRPDPSDTAG